MEREALRIGRKYKDKLTGSTVRAVPAGPESLCYGCHYYESQEFLQGCTAVRGIPTCCDTESGKVVGVFKLVKK